MWTLALGAFQFFRTNIKWVAIIMMTATIALGAIKVKNLIEANAQHKFTIQQLELDVQNKNSVIDLLKKQAALTEQIILDRDAIIDAIEETTSRVTEDLPEDEGDQAPESSKELIRRLKGSL